jgi:hypothetical protein
MKKKSGGGNSPHHPHPLACFVHGHRSRIAQTCRFDRGKQSHSYPPASWDRRWSSPITKFGWTNSIRRPQLRLFAWSQIGLDKMLAARRLARFVASSARLGSARLNFFASWADILARFVNEPARFVNEPARELNELSHFSKTKLYVWNWSIRI